MWLIDVFCLPSKTKLGYVLTYDAIGNIFRAVTRKYDPYVKMLIHHFWVQRFSVSFVQSLRAAWNTHCSWEPVIVYVQRRSEVCWILLPGWWWSWKQSDYVFLKGINSFSATLVGLPFIDHTFLYRCIMTKRTQTQVTELDFVRTWPGSGWQGEEPWSKTTAPLNWKEFVEKVWSPDLDASWSFSVRGFSGIRL